MKVINLTILCIMSLLVTALFCCSSCSTVGAFQAQTSSPNGIYTVKFLEGIESQQGLMFDNRVVVFSLSKHGRVILNNELFTREKTDKPSFAQKYPRQNWRAENVLRLGGEALPDSSCDEIVVSNLTAKEITYFDIITFLPERFIIFDLQPNSTVKLYAHPENNVAISDETFIFGGKYADRQEIKRREVTFKLRKDATTTAHFCILITDAGVYMTSTEYEGKRYDLAEMVDGLRKTEFGKFSPRDVPNIKEILVPPGECKAK